MALPSPRQIPLSTSVTSVIRNQFAVATAVTYTATAMFELYNINVKMLHSLVRINTGVEKMIKILGDRRSRDDERREEDDLEDDTTPPTPPPPAGEDSLSILIGSLKNLILGAAAILGAAIITMLDDTKKKITKEILAFTLAVTAFSRDLAADSMKFIKSALRVIPATFEAILIATRAAVSGVMAIINPILERIKTLATTVFRYVEDGISFLARNVRWFGKLARNIGMYFFEAGEFLRDLRLGERFRPVMEFVKKIKNAVMGVVGFVRSTAGIFGGIITTIAESGAMKILRWFGPVVTKLLTKLLWPIQLVLSAVDFVNGFMDGYSREGVLEGIKTGLERVFEGFFGGIVGLVDWAITSALNALGLEKTATEFSETLSKSWESIKGVFSGILEIFKGVLTLDPKMIWSGISKTYSNMKDFFIGMITGAFNIFAALFEDLTGVDLKAKATALIDWFKNDALTEIKKLFNVILDNIIGAVRWLIEKTVPYGDELAAKLFGARQMTEDEIQAETDSVFEQRKKQGLKDALQSTTGFEWLTGEKDLEEKLKEIPEVNKSPDDRIKAIDSLREKGLTAPGDNPAISKTKDVPTVKTPELTSVEAQVQAFARYDKTKEKKDANVNVTTQINNTSTSRSGESSVVIVGQTERASSSSPMSRYSPMKFR